MYVMEVCRGLKDCVLNVLNSLWFNLYLIKFCFNYILIINYLEFNFILNGIIYIFICIFY